MATIVPAEGLFDGIAKEDIEAFTANPCWKRMVEILAAKCEDTNDCLVSMALNCSGMPDQQLAAQIRTIGARLHNDRHMVRVMEELERGGK